MSLRNLFKVRSRKDLYSNRDSNTKDEESLAWDGMIDFVRGLGPQDDTDLQKDFEDHKKKFSGHTGGRTFQAYKAAVEAPAPPLPGTAFPLIDQQAHSQSVSPTTSELPHGVGAAHAPPSSQYICVTPHRAGETCSHATSERARPNSMPFDLPPVQVVCSTTAKPRVVEIKAPTRKGPRTIPIFKNDLCPRQPGRHLGGPGQNHTVAKEPFAHYSNNNTNTGGFDPLPKDARFATKKQNHNLPIDAEAGSRHLVMKQMVEPSVGKGLHNMGLIAQAARRGGRRTAFQQVGLPQQPCLGSHRAAKLRSPASPIEPAKRFPGVVIKSVPEAGAKFHQPQGAPAPSTSRRKLRWPRLS